MSTSTLTISNLFTSFKEYSNKPGNSKLCYASEKVVELVNKVHTLLYKFLEDHAHEISLEDNFKTKYSSYFTGHFCENHDTYNQIINKTIRLDIYKYTKDTLPKRKCTEGHNEKVKKFKSSKIM